MMNVAFVRIARILSHEPQPCSREEGAIVFVGRKRNPVEPIVSVKDLVKRYGSAVALDHFTLEIAPGEIFGLLGPNGSGKTTAINCILQLLTYDRGEICLFGQPMTQTRYDLKRRIGIVPQNIAVFEELSVQQNIDYFCSLYVSDAAERKQLVKRAIEFVGLEDYTRARPKKLSGGLLRRLNIACGIAHRPELIFLDEPTVAVDPQSRASILDGIKQMNAEGSTIVYTSHYMEEVEEICTRIMIMDKGHTLACGTNEELKALVAAGEKIIIEADVSEAALIKLRSLPHALRMEYESGRLEVVCENAEHNVADVLDALSAARIKPGRIWAEPPTLNDVFLEITGRELRD